jgi:hypothetical protein
MENVFSPASKDRPIETSITDGLPSAQLGDRATGLPDLRAIAAPKRPIWLSTLLSVVCHAMVLAVPILVLLVVVPKFKKVFEDFAIKLPWVSEIAIDLSDWMLDFWFIVPFALAPLLVSDLAVLYLLRRQENTRVLARLWFYLIMLFVLAGCGALVVALFLPLIELMELLSQ